MQGGTALKTRVAGAVLLVPDIFPDAVPCIPGAGAPDYSPMRAHCDWCGMDVEVLASGRCLLGHAVVPEAEMQALAPPEEAPPTDLTPRRGRRRRSKEEPAPTPPARQPVVEEPRSIRTAPTPPREERLDWPLPLPTNGSGIEPHSPRVSRPWAPVEPDGPSGPVGSGPDSPPPPMVDVAAPGLGAPLRLESPPEPMTAPVDVEGALRELLEGPKKKPVLPRSEPTAFSPPPSIAKRLRMPFRRSERHRVAVERPGDVTLPPVASPPEVEPLPPPGPEEIAPVVEEAAPAAVVDEAPPPKPSSKREPLIDSMPPPTAMRKPVAPAKKKRAAPARKTTLPAPVEPPPVPPPTPSAAAFGLPTMYSRQRAPRGGPLSPRNTVAWGLAIAAMFSAGVAALILSPSRADEGNRIRPGLRQIALGAVQDYAVRPDPETETRLRAELAAQGADPRQLSASTIVNPENGDIVALYQAIVFSSNVVGSQRDLDDFLRLFAEGAGITADAFAERVLGRRTVWSGLLDQGQAVIVFRGPEVVIVITAEVGAEGDELADAVLLARGL